MGSVWGAEPLVLQSSVAVRLLAAEIDGMSVRRCLLKRGAATINSPRVVTSVDCGPLASAQLAEF